MCKQGEINGLPPDEVRTVSDDLIQVNTRTVIVSWIKFWIRDGSPSFAYSTLTQGLSHGSVYHKQGCASSKIYRPDFVWLQPKNFWEVKVPERPKALSGRKQDWVSGAASETDPCETRQARRERRDLFRQLSANRIDDANHRGAEMKPTRELARLARNPSTRRCVFLKKVMDSIRLIIGDVIPEQMSQVTLIEDDDVIE